MGNIIAQAMMILATLCVLSGLGYVVFYGFRNWRFRKQLREAERVDLVDMFEALNVDEKLILFERQRDVYNFGKRIQNSDSDCTLSAAIAVNTDYLKRISSVGVMTSEGRWRREQKHRPVRTQAYAVYYGGYLVGITDQMGLDALYRAFY